MAGSILLLVSKYKQKKKEELNNNLVNLQLQSACRFLENHLNNISFISVKYDDETEQVIQSFKKGNITYDVYTKKRFNELSKVLNHRIKVSNGYTNAYFDTLTLPFKSVSDNHTQWDLISKYLQRYFYRLNKILKKAHYIVTLEATEQGQVHCHLIVILDKSIAYKIKDKKSYFRSQDLFKQIQDCWEYGHSKPIPVYSSKGAIFELAKYALKGNRNLKQSLNRYKNGCANSSDIKKINLFYYSIAHSKRTLRTSKGILDLYSNKSENLDITALKNNKLNEKDKKEKKIVSVSVLTNYQKLRIRFYKNGKFVPIDWNRTISITVDQNNEILKQVEIKSFENKSY